MFGLMKGSRDNYDGSVTLDKVEDNIEDHYKIETKAIEGAILKRTSRIIVYVPNRQNYVFNISTNNGNITINGGLKEVAGKVETATNLKVVGLNLKTTSGDFSWNNIYNNEKIVPLKTLIAKTNTGKFDFTLGDDITLNSTDNQYYLECKRGEFLFNNIDADKVNIVGDDVLVRANKLHTKKSFYFNAPNGFFNVTKLRKVKEKQFYDSLTTLRTVASDRAVLRAIHYFDENARVDTAAKALKNSKKKRFLEMINASGESSLTLLQNCYPSGAVSQPILLGLTLSKKNNVVKACRVHGGGFAGTIIAYTDKNLVDEYKKEFDIVFGEKNVFIIGVRNVGTCKVDI